MADNIRKVLLGFEDELITDKHKLSCMVDKIGGTPDWPDSVSLPNPSCRLCGRTLPLVCQLYAPLSNSLYHRTLYIFACVNPTCWNLDDSWVCLRCQWLDSCVPPEAPPPPTPHLSTTDWCSSANEWDDEDQENGNLAPSPEWSSEEDDDSTAFQLAGLTLDECNANANAEGKTQSPGATAEIEGAEGEVVSIDTPVRPGGNLLSVLQEVTNVGVPEGTVPQFQGVFLATGEEYEECPAGEHERELLARYNTSAAEENVVGHEESYETDRPLHGDAMCYRFLLRLRRHPQQLLRYYVGTPPLLLGPLEEMPRCCAHCRGPMACELQLLPTLIYRLQLVGSTAQHLEFGTALVWSCLHCCWAESDRCRQEVVTLQREHL